MIILPIIQKTPDWHEWRATGLGASDVAAAMGKNPYKSAKRLMDEKMKLRYKAVDGSPKKEFCNARMQRGTFLEPFVLGLYKKVIKDVELETVCGQSEEFPWLIASFDAISLDRKLVVEIKCPSDQLHADALSGKVPEYYFWQVMAQLVVSEAPKGHYVSYSDSKMFLREHQMKIVQVFLTEEHKMQLVSTTKKWWDNFLKQRKIIEAIQEDLKDLEGS